jgi:hypothetical protein
MIRMLTPAILASAAIAAAPASAHPPKPQPHPCTPKAIGFNASGTLVAHTLAQTAGADTPTRSDDRYSGTIAVTVKRADHRAPTGAQTYTLDGDRVHFSASAPKAGDRVKLHGTITRVSRTCTAAPAVDVRRVTFKPAKAAS